MDGELKFAIRKAITASGGRASSEQIKWRLRRQGLRINQHDLLKRLRLPDFILTRRGWANELRQVSLFEGL